MHKNKLLLIISSSVHVLRFALCYLAIKKIFRRTYEISYLIWHCSKLLFSEIDKIPASLREFVPLTIPKLVQFANA